MAEEKKTPVKQGWFKKLINWFANLPGRIAKAFKNMVAELHKVTWPSKKKLISSCITVIVFMVVVGAIVSLLDLGAASAVNGLYGLTHPTAERLEAPAEVVPETAGDAVVEEPVTTEGDVVVEEPTTTEGDTTEGDTTEPAATEGDVTDPVAE